MRNGSSQLKDDEEQRGKENEDERNFLMIATLHKEVEKSRKELATEKKDNERLKKTLTRLQSSQSDQMSKVVNEVEELRMKLKTAEFEKQQLLETLESCQCHHSEELKFMEECAKKRIQAMAEIHERTEERLKNELATTMAYYKGHVEKLVREGKETAASLTKWIEPLEVDKDNELSSLKKIHLSLMKTMRIRHKREVEELENPIAYAGQKLLPGAIKYSIIEKEWLPDFIFIKRSGEG